MLLHKPRSVQFYSPAKIVAAFCTPEGEVVGRAMSLAYNIEGSRGELARSQFMLRREPVSGLPRC